MQPGTIDLMILIFIFIGLQTLWIIPIINKYKNLNQKGKDLREEIKQLERIYKKFNK